MKKYLLPLLVIFSYGCATADKEPTRTVKPTETKVRNENSDNSEEQGDIIFTSYKWFVSEQTRPTDLLYVVASPSKVALQNVGLFIGITTSSDCKQNNFAIAMASRDGQPFPQTPLLPINYQINGGEIETAISTPKSVGDKLIVSIENSSPSSLLSTKGKGNVAFWIPSPSEDKEKWEVEKMYFSLSGFPEAYNKALQLCKDNIQ